MGFVRFFFVRMSRLLKCVPVCVDVLCHARYMVLVRITLSLGNRSVSYPPSSVGNAITFDVVEDTGWNLTSSVSIIRNACVCGPYRRISLGPQVLKRIEQVSVRPYTVPTPHTFRCSEGGKESVTRITLGWVNRTVFYPYSAVEKCVQVFCDPATPSVSSSRRPC